MSTRKLLLGVGSLLLVAGAARAEGPELGKPISPTELAPWDIHIMPDGTGLPPGSGTFAQGKAIYAQKCALCHGENGTGGQSAARVPRWRQDHSKLLALCHDRIRLHPASDALHTAEVADRQRGLCRDGLHPRAQQAHWRE